MKKVCVIAVHPGDETLGCGICRKHADVCGSGSEYTE